MPKKIRPINSQLHLPQLSCNRNCASDLAKLWHIILIRGYIASNQLADFVDRQEKVHVTKSVIRRLIHSETSSTCINNNAIKWTKNAYSRWTCHQHLMACFCTQLSAAMTCLLSQHALVIACVKCCGHRSMHPADQVVVTTCRCCLDPRQTSVRRSAVCRVTGRTFPRTASVCARIAISKNR